MADFLASVDVLYLTIDLDVLPACGGTRGERPGGIRRSAAGDQRRVPAGVLPAGNCCTLDVAELNPSFDIDQRTARVAARLVNTLLGRTPQAGHDTASAD